jgi:hypothetical protein
MRLMPIVLFALVTATFALPALGDCSATNIDNPKLKCTCNVSNCTTGKQCYCEDSSGGASPICECRDGTGSLWYKRILQPASAPQEPPPSE